MDPDTHGSTVTAMRMEMMETWMMGDTISVEVGVEADGGLTGFTHSSPAAECTPVCPWDTWSGPCYRRWWR